MVSPKEGDTRDVFHPGVGEVTLKGVTKLNMGGTLKVRQVYTRVSEVRVFGKDVLTFEWKNDEHVD